MRLPGPAAGEGEAVRPPSCDSARVYLDAFTGPLPVYRTRPGAAPVPRSPGLAAPAPLPSPPCQLGTGVLAEEASLPSLLVLLRSGLAPLPFTHPCAQTPEPRSCRFFVSLG